MGWWEQLITFEPPEDRWDGGDFSRDSGTVKEGTYSAKTIHYGSSTGKTFNSWGFGWDLSAYPDDAKYCFWLYCSDVNSLGDTDTIKAGFLTRFDNTMVYKQFAKSDLSTGWNFLSFPLSGMTNDSIRNRENFVNAWIDIWRISSGAVTFYIDDIYLSTDEGKYLDTEPTYLIKHFERYSTTTSKNQEYAGILEPIKLSCNRALNQVGKATFTFDIDEYDNLPGAYDTVRIYRNGMCVWDGVVVFKSKNRITETCELVCFTSNYVLTKIYDVSESKYVVLLSVDVGCDIAKYTHQADDYDGSDTWEQKGYGIDQENPCGESSTTLSQYYTIPPDEFVNPWNYIAKYQGEIEFDFEIRPPFTLNYWEPRKGRTIDKKLIMNSHFKINEEIENYIDLFTACRAKSRGGNTCFSSTQSDSTAMNNYSCMAKVINTQGKSSTEVQSAASEFVSEYKNPAVVFDIEILSGGWIHPWDLGDTITCVIEDTEYSKRIYGIDIELTERGERVGLKVQ